MPMNVDDSFLRLPIYGKTLTLIRATCAATAFGVRGLDPALTFGGTRAASKAMLKRMACHTPSTLDTNPDERKSGGKPPHCAFELRKYGGTTFGSKVSRNSHAALANEHPSPEGCWTVAGGQASLTSDTPGSRRSAIHPGWGDGVAPQFFAIATAPAPQPGCAPFFTEPGVSLVTLAQPPATLRQPSGLPCRVAAATTIAVGDEERGAHGSADADGPRSGQTTSVPFSDRAPSCSTATRSMLMPMIRGLTPTAIIVAAATRQSCPFPNHPAGPLALPSVATAFGVRGLDPALAFGGIGAVSSAMVKRGSACDIFSKLDAQSRGRKSGVKPLALPTSLDCERTGGPKVRKCYSPGKARNERSPGSREKRCMSPERAGYNGEHAVITPFQGCTVLLPEPRAALVPRFPWAITLPGFQPYIWPTLQQHPLRLVGNAKVKPTHSKASQHSHVALVVAQATSPAAVLTGDSPDCASFRRNVGRVARQDSCRRVACTTTRHRSHLANA